MSTPQTSRSRQEKDPVPLELGKYIVADPAICHGKPTFKGTRIMVSQMLQDVSEDRSWDFICNTRWRGRLPLPPVAEAVTLAKDALLDKQGRLAKPSRSALSQTA